MDFGGLFFLALVWALFKLVSKSREPSGPPPRQPGRPGLGPLQDPPREEGRALRMLLKELERAAQRQSGAAGRPAARRLPRAEEVEEPESLEITPRVQSLESAPARGERVTVDQDEEAEQVIAKRAAATAARGKTNADQRRDRQIRQPTQQTATRTLTPQQLRDAIVWREILDPPVSERGR